MKRSNNSTNGHPEDLPEDSEQLDVRFGTFEEAGTQLIAFGWVINHRKPWSNTD